MQQTFLTSNVNGVSYYVVAPDKSKEHLLFDDEDFFFFVSTRFIVHSFFIIIGLSLKVMTNSRPYLKTGGAYLCFLGTSFFMSLMTLMNIFILGVALSRKFDSWLDLEFGKILNPPYMMDHIADHHPPGIYTIHAPFYSYSYFTSSFILNTRV